MYISVKIPSPGESITEVELAKWLVEDGDIVEKDQEIAEIDSDKATLTINAEDAGKISLKTEEGETLAVGTEIAVIDNSIKPAEKPKEESVEYKHNTVEEEKYEAPKQNKEEIIISPQAQKALENFDINKEKIFNSTRGKRITKKDVLKAIAASYTTNSNTEPSNTSAEKQNQREVKTEKMSSLRKKLSQRLVAVKNETAMLTTFNEVDMSAVIEIRKKYKQKFLDKHGVKLGFMSFFAKAATIALQKYPAVNAQIENDSIKYFNYTDIGVAVSTPKGLMVPVIRNTECKSLAEIEQNIFQMAEKARNNKISIDDMQGGTFTVTNGGVFGSMLSTPIINPPQSAILGMHNIIERPVAINGKVEIRPIMYVALSYDHRIIDGRESVGFLVRIKELIENPHQMLFTDNPDNALLGL